MSIMSVSPILLNSYYGVKSFHEIFFSKQAKWFTKGRKGWLTRLLSLAPSYVNLKLFYLSTIITSTIRFYNWCNTNIVCSQLYTVIWNIFFIYVIVMNCRKGYLELPVKLVLSIIKSTYSRYPVFQVSIPKIFWIYFEYFYVSSCWKSKIFSNSLGPCIGIKNCCMV